MTDSDARYRVVCRTCDWGTTTDDGEAADTLRTDHWLGNTDHEVRVIDTWDREDQ